MQKNTRIAASLMVIMILSGCNSITLASRDDITETYQKLQTAGDDLSKVTDAHAKNIRTVRRDLAVSYLMSHELPGDENGNPVNLNPNHIDASFANYVCAGVQQGTGPLRGSAYVSQYNKHVAKILKLPPDTLIGQVKALQAFAEAETAIVPVPAQEDAAKAETDCREAVIGLLAATRETPITSVVVAEAVNFAGVLAIYEAIKGLAGVVETGAKNALKIPVELQSRKQLTEFVLANRENFNKVLSQNLKAAELDEAWRLRRAATLYRPYLLFKQALSTTPEGSEFSIVQAVKVRKSFDTIDKTLSEFDAMSITPSPASFVKSVKKSHDALVKLAENQDISLSVIIGFLSGMSDMVETVRTDWDALGVATEAARNAFP
jgi:hypothetical protein